MQNDLFNGSWELTTPSETLDEIKAEMIDKAKSIPELANRFAFIFVGTIFLSACFLTS